MITIIAFVINIGLFVKAKINLQNATDAAAFAGASVQSRQLSKIAYLNWEMRNVYKEWLYKYYVVGNLNIEDVKNPNTSSSKVMKYKLLPQINPLDGNKVVQQDLFNIPAICIHLNGSKTNICRQYSIFGLPEFQSSNVSGAEEASRAFMDALISTKINDCIDRSQLNMMVANTWTYNVLGNSMDDSLVSQGPAILSDRQGAWPRAVELALRIRNLEYVMNRPSEDSKICKTGSTNLTNCGKSISEIEQEKKLGNERIVKAFYSAYRNLGNEVDNEMKNSFTLTELPPKKFSETSDSASNLLIPIKKNYEKQWVDLKLMMVNYAIFFAAMIPNANSQTSGSCDISKVAIPVPGYPLGFYKNPDVVTYYAVKGEAEFMGMFNPFVEGAVKLQAYAAAKPMGGRIGPMLFTQKPGENYITGRTDSQKLRSIPYITSYQFEGVTIRGKTYSEGINNNGQVKTFIPGLPIPTNSKAPPGSFWLESPDNPVGGKLANAEEIQFGVPNLVYDYETPFYSNGYTLATDPIHSIDATDINSEQPVGLFSTFQFSKFKGPNLQAGTPITPEILDAEIARIRAPTLYEAANYLIPTHHDFNLKNNLDSFGFITPQASPLIKNGIEVFQSQVYAPLYQSNDQKDLLFENRNDVTSTVFEYMGSQETGMKKYLMAMNRVAKNIFDTKDQVAAGAVGSKPGYERAAESVSDIDFNNFNLEDVPGSCKSLAGKFLYFYFGEVIKSSLAPKDPTGCPVPLGKLLEEYYSSSTTDQNYDPNYYSFDFSFNSNETNLNFMTAYLPGPFTGATNDGNFLSPLNPDINDRMRRNFYSAKFISLDSVQPIGSRHYGNESFAIHSEGDVNPSAGAVLNTSQKQFRNPLDVDDKNLNSIRY